MNTLKSPFRIERDRDPAMPWVLKDAMSIVVGRFISQTESEFIRDTLNERLFEPDDCRFCGGAHASSRHPVEVRAQEE